ncbi:MAG: hypothetical protein V4565_07005 [Bacteroidota bacterium]
MENNSNTYFDDTYELIKKYTDDRLLLLKIQSAKKTAKFTSIFFYIFTASILTFFALLFVGFMLAHYFSEKMNSMFYGFATVAGMFLVLLMLFIIFYKIYFSGKVKNKVTAIFFERDPNDLIDDDED